MNEFAMPTGDLLVAAEHRDWADTLLTQMAQPQFAESFNQKITASQSGDDFWDERLSRFRPYRVENGVLTIPVQGMLVSRFPYTFGGFITGYEYIEAAIARGVDDSNVSRIVLDIDSPGGTVAGCFDCADAIYEARGKKPILAVANESAYSAAYALASAADAIAVSRTGGVGSVGVILTHIEMSGRLEQAGVTVTLIYAGERKKDGNPYEPLSEEARKRAQARIDALYEIFVSTVARNRGLDAAAVRATEAATYMASEAIEIGLADAVGGLDSLSAYADPLENDEDEEMSQNDNSAVAQAATEEALAAARAAGVTEGAAQAATAERERIAAILGSEEGKKRPALAHRLAMTTDMTVEKATELLAGLPEEKAEGGEESPSKFERQMESGSQPGVGAGEGAEVDEDEAFMASYRAMTGRA